MSAIHIAQRVSETYSNRSPELIFAVTLLVVFAIALALYLDLPNLRNRRAREINRKATHVRWLEEYQQERTR